MIVFLVALTATFHPPAPSVGDPITIEFRQQPVVLDPSSEYEIVSQEGSRVVVRTFQPRPFALSGRVGNVYFRNLHVPVRSVLRVNDPLDPAPLKPPQVPPAPRLPWIATGIAALVAALAWAVVVVAERRRDRARIVEPELAPAERFRRTVQTLCSDTRRAQRWAELADATRRFLASLSPHLGVELTTAELLPRLDAVHTAIVAEVLRQGDLEKFSPWGPQPRDFDGVANAALTLIPEPVVVEEAA
jgi:hypothetical protein